jgi:hypothetical protein
MPYRRGTFHSFIFPSHSRRDSFSLPDYYRQTRLEQYGPYYRSSESAQDLMVTFQNAHILVDVTYSFLRLAENY